MITENGGSLPVTSLHNNVRVLSRINSCGCTSGAEGFSRVSVVPQSSNADSVLHYVSNGARVESVESAERWLQCNEHRCFKERAVNLCVLCTCVMQKQGQGGHYRHVSLIPWKVILMEPLLWNMMWHVVNNCGSSCPDRGLYTILLGAMPEGRIMRVKANRVINLRHSCLTGSLSFGSQERTIVWNWW